jgi:uncharacterized protein YciI
MELESFELVFLVRPENPPDFDDAILERLQGDHLAFYDRLRAEGVVATNGPVLDPPDDSLSLRGLAFFKTGSLEAAREVAEQDPSVMAGRLAVEVMTWWCAPGTMAIQGTPLTAEA